MSRPHIELSVRLTDGTFETKLTIPAGTPADRRDALVGAWLGLMDEAAKAATAMEANQ